MALMESGELHAWGKIIGKGEESKTPRLLDWFKNPVDDVFLGDKNCSALIRLN